VLDARARGQHEAHLAEHPVHNACAELRAAILDDGLERVEDHAAAAGHFLGGARADR
jgi:hypothetical protein